MHVKSVLKRHAGLVDDMADAVGVDLQEQMLRGDLSISELDDAVMRCTGCSNPDDCESWLASQTGAVDTPPAYCRNADVFAALKKA
ncbi:MAG: DUF6455 family protein [Paracoccaceae bacterium]|nr:DUF6455 family protein [Paracoccaceae bacterium]